MYLSKFTDYNFRILIYLGNHPNEIFTVDELSSILGLSTNHIKKSYINYLKIIISILLKEEMEGLS